MTSNYRIGRFCASIVGAFSFVISVFCGIFVIPAIGSGPAFYLLIGTFSGAFICAACFAMIAVFDIADRLGAGVKPSAVDDGIPPTPGPPPDVSPSDPTPTSNRISEPPPEVASASPSKEDRDAEVARKIADYESRKRQ